MANKFIFGHVASEGPVGHEREMDTYLYVGQNLARDRDLGIVKTKW